MKTIRVSIIPQPTTRAPKPRRETVFKTLRREWQRVTRPSYAGYSEQ